MKNLSDIGTVKKLLERYGFKFSKSLGQNFIVSPSVCPAMAGECSNSKNAGIIEIGPGIGVLTAQLAKRFKKVVSIEIDKKLIPIIQETTSDFENIKIINSDVLKTDLNEIIQTELFDCDEICVCANLPYYITSEIIMYILENNFEVKSMVVMVQKEAAERICAEPGTRESGTISIAVRYYGVPKILFNVKKGCFLPQPKVDSSVIKIDRDETKSKNIKNKKMFFKVVRAAYSKRRKNLLNSLSMGLGISRNEIKEILKIAGVGPSYRAEQLKFEEFTEISNVLFRKDKN